MSLEPLHQVGERHEVLSGRRGAGSQGPESGGRAGEILVLVGPSGCGKSTTLRLINRMIEPTSGRIIYEGEDVTKSDPNELRRRMGYVIQQIGLFPHRTIAENIATVPKLLKWPKDKIRARVDELT